MSVELLRALRKAATDTLEALARVPPCECWTCKSGWPCEKAGVALIRRRDALDGQIQDLKGQMALDLLNWSETARICSVGNCRANCRCPEIAELLKLPDQIQEPLPFDEVPPSSEPLP